MTNPLKPHVAEQMMTALKKSLSIPFSIKAFEDYLTLFRKWKTEELYERYKKM